MLVMTTSKIEAVFRAVPKIKDRIIDELTCMDAVMVARAQKPRHGWPFLDVFMLSSKLLAQYITV